MRFFYIDFENVHSDGLIGLDELNETDVVYFFYSDNANALTFDLHFKIGKSKCVKRYFRAERTTKNALDFQIVTFLGANITKFPDAFHLVITHDGGFDSAIDFWKAHSIDSLVHSNATPSQHNARRFPSIKTFLNWKINTDKVKQKEESSTDKTLEKKANDVKSSQSITLPSLETVQQSDIKEQVISTSIIETKSVQNKSPLEVIVNDLTNNPTKEIGNVTLDELEFIDSVLEKKKNRLFLQNELLKQYSVRGKEIYDAIKNYMVSGTYKDFRNNVLKSFSTPHNEQKIEVVQKKIDEKSKPEKVIAKPNADVTPKDNDKKLDNGKEKTQPKKKPFRKKQPNPLKTTKQI